MKKFEQLKMLDESGLYKIPVDSVDGRVLKSQGRTLIDFVNTNYLGFEYSLTQSTRAAEFQEKWGALCGWSRMEIDSEIYPQLEQRLSQFLGVKESLLAHTITITNFSMIPGISAQGEIFADELVHAVVFEACRLARDHGSQLTRFRHQDLNHLEELLKQSKTKGPKLIAVDGVYSVSGETADIRGLMSLCRKYDAWLYVDDAHGFGVLGNRPTAQNSYGTGGTGVVNYHGEKFDRCFYVSSFGKAFSSQTAFITIPDEYKENYKSFCTQFLFSAGVSPRTVAEVHDVMDFNDREGETRRKNLRSLVSQFKAGLTTLSFEHWNVEGQPVIYLPVGDIEQFMAAAKFMDDRGFIAGLRAYPLVAKNQCGFRFAITALHNENQIDSILNALSDLKKALKTSVLLRGAA